MEILGLGVNWMTWCGNMPHWMMLVDALPGHDELTFEFRDKHVFAETPDGYVAFNAIHPEYRNGNLIPAEHRGYGGATLRFRLRDGSELVSSNAWSSAPSNTNHLGFTPSVDMVFTDRPQDWAQERGFGGLAGHLTLAALRRALECFPLEVGGLSVAILREPFFSDDRPIYLPTLGGLSWKDAKARVSACGASCRLMSPVRRLMTTP